MNKLLVLFTIIAFLSLGSTAAATELSMYNISLVGGYIYDDVTNDGIGGATVTVLCIGNSETRTDTTDSNGFYFVMIPCSENDTIQVTATAGSKSGSNSANVTHIWNIYMYDSDWDYTLVDVGLTHVDVTIPEFPITALPAVLSMLSFGLVRRRLF